MKFFATAAKGTEPALRDELRELQFQQVRCDRGGVHFQGDFGEGYRACLHSRIALRILTPLARFEVLSSRDLYDGVRAIDWTPYLKPYHTLSVSSACKSSTLTHTQYIAQKTKDAIVDQIRDRYNSRPNVARKNPDVHIFVHLVNNRAEVFLDLAGESLHRRGYRAKMTDATLRETIAATMLRYSLWDRQTPLLDPLCGSGTIAIEAAMLAAQIAPGILRPHFGFEQWACYDQKAAALMSGLREKAHQAILSDYPEIMASDADPRAIAATNANALAAQVRLTTRKRKFQELSPTLSPGIIITNPPYGKRIEMNTKLYQDMITAFQRFQGVTFCLLSQEGSFEPLIKNQPYASHPLYNGDIECQFLIYHELGGLSAAARSTP